MDQGGDNYLDTFASEDEAGCNSELDRTEESSSAESSDDEMVSFISTSSALLHRLCPYFRIVLCCVCV
jgi:hypothetical protein